MPEALLGKIVGPTEPEIDAAMDRYAQGDPRAFAIVHAGLYPRLRIFLQRLCRTQAQADDLVQDTFLRMHRARGSFAEGGRALPWAYAIARNAHTDFTRSAHVRKSRPLERDDDEQSQEIPAGPSADAEEVNIARQTAKLVDDAIARLPAAQREAFILLRYEGMSVADAAQILGATENAVKLRAFHAYEALRAALGIEKDKDKQPRGRRSARRAITSRTRRIRRCSGPFGRAFRGSVRAWDRRGALGIGRVSSSCRSRRWQRSGRPGAAPPTATVHNP